MKKNSAWLKPWKIMLIVLASFAGSFIAKWSFLYFLYTCNNFDPLIILTKRAISFSKDVIYSYSS